MNRDPSITNDAQVGAMIDELAQSTTDAVKHMRHHARLNIRVKVYVEPASLSARTSVRLQGVTGDLSAGGAQILLPRPLAIGDAYHVSFDRDEFDLAPVFALCLRGRMVRPDAFEAGIRFLESIQLPTGASKHEGSIL